MSCEERRSTRTRSEKGTRAAGVMFWSRVGRSTTNSFTAAHFGGG